MVVTVVVVASGVFHYFFAAHCSQSSVENASGVSRFLSFARFRARGQPLTSLRAI